MPLTVFDIERIPGSRRERIEPAVVTGGKQVAGEYEGWIASDPFDGGVLITGSTLKERGRSPRGYAARQPRRIKALRPERHGGNGDTQEASAMIVPPAAIMIVGS